MENYAKLYFSLADEAREKGNVATDVRARERLLKLADAYEAAAKTFEAYPEAA